MSKSDQHVWAIDGIEEETARIEEDGERIITVPRYLLPADAREGQLLRVTRAGGRGKEPLTVTIEIDEEATSAGLVKSKATTTAAMDASRKRDRGGDVAL
jgi:hypothetical protein